MRWVHRPRRSSLQPFEQRFEIGKAGADRRHIVDLDRRLADQPGDREAHADAVVEVAGDGRAAGKRIAAVAVDDQPVRCFLDRSEAHTSEPQSLMRLPYAVLILTNK